MDNTLVSARVSRAKKERVSGILASIGATTSDLINSAFDFVIASKELPSVEKADAPSEDAFRAFVANTTLDVAWPQKFEGDYKSLIARMRKEDYEALDRY